MGVYLSYPFCAQKCTYCNFASGVLPRALEPRYIEALRAEIHAAAWPWTPETVYLGGGTPSTMDAGGLAALLASIPGKPWKEAAIEAAPGTLTPERAAAWTAAGINRVSLGVQSFNTAELRRTGRRHTAETVASDVALLRAAGIGAISCDLIAGLPAQTVESWEESLDWIARLDIPHVSVYMLEVDEDSRLGREMLLGGVRYGAAETPDEDAIVACYTRAIERLARLGLERYEISNFARPGCESLHNLKYWRLEPYLGFGSDA
ncbi:MAG: coproporphyrinogen III oxidase family protein, partial [Bryobacterales bacterium]|nr:coproporphyrinogen III oxidase family protein [Bryobacterales bacterium]